MRRCLPGLILVAFGIVTGLLSAPAFAGVIVDYNLTNIVTSSASPAVTAPATTVASGVTATDITRGPGLTPITLARGFSSQGWNNGTNTVTTRSDAISGNKYYAFAVTIAAGSTASFSDITVGLYKSAQTSPANIEWQYSLDGFTSAGTTLVAFDHYGRNSGTAGSPTPFQWMSPPYNNGGGPVAIDTPGQTNGNSTGALDISAVSALQNLAGPATVSFRLYGWGSITGGATTTTNTLALGRDIGPLINGTVVSVPEPSGIALACAGAGLAVACRLRRRRA